MIHTVTAANRSLYGAQIDRMHAMRHDMYVKQRGWTDMVSRNEREYDEFDTEEAVYLMNLSPEGNLRATFRLMPTTSPYLLNKLSQFVSGTPPQSAKIWDMTRWIIAPEERRKPGEQRGQAQAELACGLYEFAASRNLTHFTTLTDVFFLPALEAAGWKYEPLGLPTPYDGGKGVAIAILIDVGKAALQHIRMVCDIDAPMLFEAAPPRADDTIEDILMQAELLQTLGAAKSRVQRLRLLNEVHRYALLRSNTAQDHLAANVA